MKGNQCRSRHPRFLSDDPRGSVSIVEQGDFLTRRFHIGFRRSLKTNIAQALITRSVLCGLAIIY